MKLRDRKGVVFLVLVLVAGLLLAGCGGGKENKSADQGAGQEQTKPVEYDLATAYAADSAPGKVAEKFSELVDQKTGGKVKINVFAGGSLGSEKENFLSVSSGSLPFVLGGTTGIAAFEPQYDWFVAPYLMKDAEQIRNIWNGELGARVKAAMESHNLKYLGMMKRGNRQTTANKPIKNLSDVSGLKLRLPEQESWLRIWKGLGALPTPIPLPELYGALQTKVADASEGPFEQIATFRLDEVQKYLILTDHVVDVTYLWVEKSLFDGLSADVQKAIEEAATEALAYGDQLVNENDQKLFQELQRRGMQVVEPDVEAFREKAAPLLDDLFKNYWKSTTLEEIQSYAK